MEGLRTFGDPKLGLFIYGGDVPVEEGGLDAFKIYGRMLKRGWFTGLVTDPRSIHLMLSPAHAGVVDAYLSDLTEAVKENASDIHIEPFENRLVVRFRSDGVLREVLEPQRVLAPLLVSRIKVMARLDIAEKRLPQDGRISLRVAGRAVDVRVSTLPSGNGERVVLRLLDKRVNEGKALALNDALPLCRGEILVLLDADIIASPSLLRSLVPHFASPRVAAVTGNPRVANRETLLQQLQSLEFSSIISVQRRAQRVWGRVLTVSGAVVAVRKTALIEVGRFSPDMATEDIELTWRMQRHFMDVRYEARAVVWMQVPPTVAELWKQRRRWARGLTQVLLRHWKVPFEWKTRRMWPVFYEAVASILWAYTFVLVTAYWIVASMLGHAPYGATPVPNLWGMLIASACVVQLLTGVLMDCRYDDKLLRHFPVAIVYPVIYWMLMSVITSIYTIEIFFRRQPEVQRWRIRRAAR